jgi:hypothetical protein
MKTWEMLKELTENPKKRFKRKNWEGVYICSKNGFICDSNGDRYGIYDVMEDLDGGWEELPREVTWQEAIEAWINKERIEVWQEVSLVYRSSSGYKLGASEKDKGYHFDRSDFTKGKWYILEGTK